MAKASTMIMATMTVMFMAALAATPTAEAASSCSVDNEAMKMLPCYSAALSEKAPVTTACCDAMRKTTDFACMCQALLSDTAKSAGINPAAAISIPKRCGIVNRPVGYKCGGYTVP